MDDAMTTAQLPSPATIIRTRRSPLRRRVAALTALITSVSLLSFIPAAPVHAAERLKGQTERLGTTGKSVHGVARGFAPQSGGQAPKAAWPNAGAATVQLRADVDHGKRVQIPVKAGPLPISIARANDSDDLSTVSVETLDRAQVPTGWRDGLMIRVKGGPAQTHKQKARLSVDYSAFRYAYGAEWDQRLALWLVPECAITSPGKPGCTATRLTSRNDSRTTTVTADIDVLPQTVTANGTQQVLAGNAAPQVESAGTLVALAAGATSPSGDFTATSLAPSATWSVGGSAGGFAWNYPLQVPPSASGLEPELAIGYSSAAVDGRGEATNNQPSWIGEGFEYAPGYIERNYVSCSEDMSGTHNNTTPTGDECWRSDNATMNLNGGGSELIYQQGKGWHARSEDGSKIEKLTGASNGDEHGEYWKVTSSDGTQYFFGRNNLPGQSASTNSVNTVPVYSNHPADPDYVAGDFTGSRHTRAWRWNLDYIIDIHGNTMSMWYTKYTNRYATQNTDTSTLAYDRDSVLSRIDYGTYYRTTPDFPVSQTSITPTGQVLFTSADRCMTADCAKHDPTNWPDTPWDQECTSTTSCPTKYSPTFWTTKRLQTITTQVWNTTITTPAWQPVSAWTLAHSFPPVGDGSVHRGMWLDSITRAGLVDGTTGSIPGVIGAAVTMPPITFEPMSMPNRVLTPTGSTNNWQRLANIITETGAKIQVTYSLPECSDSNKPTSAWQNTKRCYPVLATDPDNPDGPLLTNWWHKYVVTQVSESDLDMDGHGQTVKNTFYAYLGSPAWHYADDDGLSKPKFKTWSQFRGYATVQTRTGTADQQTLVEAHYLRGMHADKTSPSGGTTTVTVPASIGSETVNDEDQFAGMLREQITYNGTTDKPISKTVSVPWRSSPTASRTINGDTAEARYTGIQTSYQATALGANLENGWRTTSTQTWFDDTYGVAIKTQDNGDLAKSDDQKCTTTDHVRNTDKNLLTTVSRVRSWALACNSPPATEDDIMVDIRNSYDGQAPGDVPTFGNLTKVEKLNGWDPSQADPTQRTIWQTAAQNTFDDTGRIISATDAKGVVSQTVFTPTIGGPVTHVKLTSAITTANPAGWVSNKDLMPYWGTTSKTTDPNGRITEGTYDALGRLRQVWNPGWSKAEKPAQPSTEYIYSYSPTRSDYPYVNTKGLNAAGNYMSSYEIFDGLLRTRQLQIAAVGGGRVVSDTLYDAVGRAVTQYGAHAETGAPSGTLLWISEGSARTVTKTVYDRASRPTATVYWAPDATTNLVEKWRTSTVYGGDFTAVTPPEGGTAVTTVTDARGHTTAIKQHNTALGIAGASIDTVYDYDPKGQLVKVTDPMGNQWTTDYDSQGHVKTSIDPDAGTSRFSYTPYGEIETVTDGRGEVVAYAYDQLGRKTAVYDDNITTGTKRAEWKYDKYANGLPIRGQLTQRIRYDGGKTYKTSILGFTPRYQPTGVTITIPAGETGLAGMADTAYTFGYNYSSYNEAPTSVSYPAVGDLTSETVTTRYDDVTGLPVELKTNAIGVGTYVTNANNIGQQYTAYGEPTINTRKTSTSNYVDTTVDYDPTTRRIARNRVQPQTAAGTVVDTSYSYTDAGTIEGISDTPAVGAADRQCFRYDELGRLTTAWTSATEPCDTDPTATGLGTSAPYWQTWTFDDAGNQLTRIDRDSTSQTTVTFGLPTQGAGVVRPHAVKSIKTEKPGSTVTQAQDFDDAGNTTSRPGPIGAGQTLGWDSEGKLATVTESGSLVESNLYDSDGARLIRRDATGKTLYLPGMEARYANGNTTLAATRYYSFAGQTIAQRTSAGLVWLFSDHQSTQQVSVDAAGQTVRIRRQTPYGALRGTATTWPNQKGFVGGDNDPVGLTNIGARAYDTNLGRFVKVDPLMDLADPTSFNPYSYAHNSPISNSDPSGLYNVSSEPGGGGPNCDIVECLVVSAQGLYLQVDDDRKGKRSINGHALPKGGPQSNEITRRIDKHCDTTDDLNCLALRGHCGAKQADCLMTVDAAIADLLWDVFQNCKECSKEFLDGLNKDSTQTGGMAGNDESPGVRLPGFGFKNPRIGIPRSALTVKGTATGRGSACGNSFQEGTLVLLADGTAKPIEDLALGDEVLASDPAGGQATPEPAIGLIVGKGPKELVELTLDRDTAVTGTISVLVATANHPFLLANEHRWVEARELKIGDRLQGPGSANARVTGVRTWTEFRSVYNLTVGTLHTYYVLAGNIPVLVHNAGPCEHVAVGLQTVGDNDIALDEFGMERGALTYSSWPGKGPWYKKFTGFLGKGSTTRMSVNLDGIKDPVASARSGAKVDPSKDYEGLTDWELHQISQNPGAWDRITFYRGGTVVDNPFA